MPKVSVIIPTYKRCKLLREAISSVLAQTFQDLAIIVVDDASKDDTEEVVRSFHCDRIRYVQHHANLGGAAARNTGIKHASSEYIAFLDDDDTWLPRKLELQVALLDDSSREVGAVYTGYKRVDRNSGELLSVMVPTKEGNVFDALLVSNCIGTTSSVLLRKQCFEDVGLFDARLPSHQDYDMWLRISRAFKFTYIREPLLIYYLHNNRVTTNPEARAQGLEIMMSKWGTRSVVLRRAYSYRYMLLGVLYCLHGEIRKGRGACYKAIRMYPFGLKSYAVLTLSFLGSDKFRKVLEMKKAVMGMYLVLSL